jgi:hypothetical protein
MSSQPCQRVIHMTFHKCGSQWVRDVLTAPEISSISGFSLDGRSANVPATGWPADQQESTLLGPLYNVSLKTWMEQRKPGDKGLIVIRDPRDRMISWMFSIGYSHRPGGVGTVDMWRELYFATVPPKRLLLGMLEFSRMRGSFESWIKLVPDDATLLTRYEDLISDQKNEFRKIFDFLGWQIPDEAVTAAVDRLSFEKRSGRERGEANIYSHYRKGISGDWRNHFTREFGEIFETRFPNILTSLGYETSSEWYHDLPEKLDDAEETETGAKEIAELRAELTRITEQRDELKTLQGSLLEERKRAEEAFQAALQGVTQERDRLLAAVNAANAAREQESKGWMEKLKTQVFR